MIDVEDRLREHLAHEAAQIIVPEGMSPSARRPSLWSGIFVVPVAATLVVVALIGFVLLSDRSQPLFDSPAVGSDPVTESVFVSPTTEGGTDVVTQEAVVDVVESIPGSGLVFAPDHPMMLSAVVDPDLPGCEGFAAATWRQVDLRDGSMRPVGDGSVTGTAITFDERVAVVDQCEGFIDSINIGTLTAEGSFTLEGGGVDLDEDLTQATLAADRVRDELVLVTPDNLSRLDITSGELSAPEPTPFPVQPSSVSVVGEYLVAATFEGELEVGVYHRSGGLVESLPRCSVVTSDLVGEEAVVSGACGIYVVGSEGSPRLFSDTEVLTAKALPNSDSVLAFTLAPNGAAGDWKVITPEGEALPVPGSDQATDVVASPDGDLLAVPSADAESTRIFTTGSVIA